MLYKETSKNHLYEGAKGPKLKHNRVFRMSRVARYQLVEVPISMKDRYRLCATMLVAFAATASIQALGFRESIDYPVDFETETTALGGQVFRLAVREPVTMTDDDQWIAEMPEDSYLFVQKQIGWRTMHLVVEGTNSGDPRFRLWINSIRRHNSHAHRELIGEVLQEAARVYGVGGYGKMMRLYETEGIDASLAVIRAIKPNEVKVRLLRDFLDHVKVNAADVDELIRVVSYAYLIPNGSDRAEFIIDIALSSEASDAVTIALLDATRSIPGSTQSARTIIQIVDTRGLTAESAQAMYRAIRTIPSSSGKLAVLVATIDKVPHSPETIQSYIGAARAIPSSNDKKEALQLLLIKGLLTDPANVEQFANTALSIPSSSDKTRLLIDFINTLPFSPGISAAYLSTARSIISASDKAFAVTSYVEKLRTLDTGIDPHYVVDTLELIRTIISSSDKLYCLREVARLEMSNPEIIDTYLFTSNTLLSSSDKASALIALVAIEDVDDFTLGKIAAFADNSIRNEDDRGLVIKAIREAR